MSFYSEASLAYVASAGAGKDGKTYSMKPVDGTGDFTFSRGSNLAATRVGPTGLIEKGRENLLLQSNQFDTTWTNYLSTETSGQIGYDGSSDAWLLTKSDASGQIRQNVTSSGVATFSVYAKANASDYIQIVCGSVYQYFNLSLGTLGAGSGIAAAIEAIGTNGWYRCSVSFNSSITSVRIYPAENNTASGTSGSIYIQDAQLEIGLAATDYIESGASTGKAGLLEDEPRFDYSGGATCPSLLLEPSRTNKLPYSEYFGAWTIQSGITLTPNTDETLSPEGLNNAYKIVSTIGTTGFYFAGLNSSVESVRSIYLKGSAGGETLALKDPSGNGSFTSVTLTTEWQRFTHSTSNTGQNYQGLQIDDISVGTIYAYGAQWEEASYPTSYIPNHSGGTITRGADEATLSNINTNIVDITGDFTFFVDNTGSLMKGNELYYYFIELYWDALTSIRYYSTSNGSWYFKPDNDYTGFSNSVGRQIIKYENGVFYHFLNGSKSTDTRTMATANSLSRIEFLTNTQGKAGYLDVKQALLFDTALSDADCITLTT